MDKANLYNQEYTDAKQREEYHLTSKDGNILSDVFLLNGTPLKLTNTHDIPAMNPQLVDSTLPIKIWPDSIVFSHTDRLQGPSLCLEVHNLIILNTYNSS